MILAVCDSEIHKKRFEDDKRQLDLSSEFYNGSEMNAPELIELMKKAYLLNLAGTESVKCGVEAGFVLKENIGNVSGVPFAQAVVVTE